MSNTPKHRVEQAIKVMNETFALTPERGQATLIDWRAYDDGLAINVEETGIDACDFSADATIHGALPRGTFLEQINNCSLRLVRA